MFYKSALSSPGCQEGPWDNKSDAADVSLLCYMTHDIVKDDPKVMKVGQMHNTSWPAKLRLTPHVT